MWKLVGDEWILEHGIDEETTKRRLALTNAKWNRQNIVRMVKPV